MLFGGLGHALGFVQRQRHRFLHHHMLAVLGRDDGVLAVELIGCGDPYHLHLWVAVELFY
jgi:hypothetical protein